DRPVGPSSRHGRWSRTVSGRCSCHPGRRSFPAPAPNLRDCNPAFEKREGAMVDEIRFDRRMSDADALMWAIEKDPLLRSTITAIAVLERAPDRERFTERMERASRLIPRLRQRVVASPLVPAPPRWVVDPNFDLRYHLRWVQAPAPGSLRTLLDLAEPIAMQGFDRARPLWEFTVVEGLADGKAALIQKLHHSITDGVGAIKIAMHMLDLEREPAE